MNDQPTMTMMTAEKSKENNLKHAPSSPCEPKIITDPTRQKRLSVAAGVLIASYSSTNDAAVVLNRNNPFNVFRERVVVAMVGLPARGKSFISKAIMRYMNFLGCPTELFNAGNSRRKQGLAGTDAKFFDPNNAEGKAAREQMAMDCLEDLLAWTVRPEGGCSIGILDATNTTVERRKKIVDRIRAEAEIDPTVRLLFVESCVDDPELLENNYRMKLVNDDYRGADPEKALADFRERVEKYEAVYETITDDEARAEGMAYAKTVNAGKKLSTRLVEGFVMRKIQRLLGAIHLWPRTIWLVLVGESTNDRKYILGGDSELSEEGIAYSRAVRDLVEKRSRIATEEEGKVMSSPNWLGANTVTLYTGTLQRHIQSADIISSDADGGAQKPNFQVLTMAHSNDLCAGIMDSMSREEQSERYPEEVLAREADMLNYRYPGVGGESYQDIIARGSELTCLLEQSRGNSIVVCDRALYKVLLGYFSGKRIDEIPTLAVKGGVLELKRTNEGFETVHHHVRDGKATNSAGKYPSNVPAN